MVNSGWGGCGKKREKFYSYEWMLYNNKLKTDLCNNYSSKNHMTLFWIETQS